MAVSQNLCPPRQSYRVVKNQCVHEYYITKYQLNPINQDITIDKNIILYSYISISQNTEIYNSPAGNNNIRVDSEMNVIL